MRITDYAALAAVDPADVLVAVDVSDTSSSAAGTTKRVLASTLLAGVLPSGDSSGATDTATIQGLLNAGAPAVLGPGVFNINATITVPPGAVLSGSASFDTKNWGRIGTVLYPTASFTGSTVLSVSDGGVNGVAGPKLRRLGIDGSRLPASVSGITITGQVNEGVLEDINIAQTTAAGLVITASGFGFPHSWHGQRVKVNAANGNGFSISGLADSTLVDFYALGCTGHGFSLSGSLPNTRLIGFRSEWNTGSGKAGYFISGAWGTGTGSGGLELIGCTTDRNDQHGWMVNATGTVPLILTGCSARRDGRNGGSGGGSFAGLNVNAATIPVIINGFSVFPGVDDNGTGTNSPQIGGQVIGTNSMVLINGAHFHGQTTGWATPGTGVHTRGMSQSTGSTSSPTGPTQVTDIT